MGLLLAERLLNGLHEDTARGRLEEVAAAKVLDDAVAVAEWVFLQVVVLLPCLLLDPRVRSTLGRFQGSPKAAKICEMSGLSDIMKIELEGERCKE